MLAKGKSPRKANPVYSKKEKMVEMNRNYCAVMFEKSFMI